MSVEVVPGGQRRIDRVLDPGFTDGVDRLGLPELRARREEADVSYLRRLLQGRAVDVPAHEEEQVSTHRRTVQRVVDVLRGELARRYRDGTAQVSQLLA
jgi:hypothetical protein